MSIGSAPAIGLTRVAEIDVEALERNIGILAAANPDTAVCVDARANAYGHGVNNVVAAIATASVSHVLVSTESEAALANAAGLEPVRDVNHSTVAGGFTTSGIPVLSLDVYGFDSLEPVMTVRSEIVAIKKIAAGTGVSYGYSFRAEEATTIGLVSLGYSDGIPRLASNRGIVSIGGIQFPLVGRIAMDQFVVNLGSYSAEIGDEVVLWGAAALGHPTIATWATVCERTAADLTAGLGSRVSRVTRGGAQ